MWYFWISLNLERRNTETLIIISKIIRIRTSKVIRIITSKIIRITKIIIIINKIIGVKKFNIKLITINIIASWINK